MKSLKNDLCIGILIGTLVWMTVYAILPPKQEKVDYGLDLEAIEHCIEYFESRNKQINHYLGLEE